MTIEVRILGADEASVLANLDVGVFDDPICETSAKLFLEDSRHRLVVAICDGQVVGFASGVIYFHPDKLHPELWINELAVAAEHQRRGIGTRLLQTLFDAGRSDQCSEAWVLTERDNLPAMSLYSAVGGILEEHDPAMFTFPLTGEWSPSKDAERESTSGPTRVSDLMRRLYSIVSELESLLPGRTFAPDDHLAGSLGVAWASYLYDIDLDKSSAPEYDGTATDGRRVQIKTTQGNSIEMSVEPEHLLVLELRGAEMPSEIYNGPGSAPWKQSETMQQDGQRHIDIAKLHALMSAVPPEDRLPRVASL